MSDASLSPLRLLPLAGPARPAIRPSSAAAAGRPTSFRAEAQAAFDALDFHAKDALRRFRDANGRAWKSKLRELWAVAALDRHPEGDALRRVRNSVGPSGLDMVRL